MIKVTVKAIGHGLGYNNYPVEFDFTLNGSVDDFENDDYEKDKLNQVTRKKAQRKTACNSVTILSTSLEDI